METTRLRAIQHPSRATVLLESVVESLGQVPADSDRVGSVDELTAPLRRLVRKSESGEVVWCAWTKGLQIWFFSAVPSLELARERRKPVLQVTSHDEHGAITATASYVNTPLGWQQCF